MGQFSLHTRTSGWSGRGGLTLNPYALDRNPSGSSAGSGAAASANLCAVAVGTETDGSVTAPSSCNGLVGIKPTVGLISRSGIVPIAHSQDTAGPMARTVADAAILLGCLAGADAEDPATAAAAGKMATRLHRVPRRGGPAGSAPGRGAKVLWNYGRSGQLDGGGDCGDEEPRRAGQRSGGPAQSRKIWRRRGSRCCPTNSRRI